MSALTMSSPTAVDTLETGPTPRPSPRSRRRPVVVLAGKIVLALLVAIAVSSCAHRAPTPTSYGNENSTIQKNFISGCTGTKNRQAGDTPASHSTCECLWAGIKKEIPFADFKKINSDLTDKNGPLPAVMQAIVTKCNG